MEADDQPLVKVPHLLPEGPTTGFAHRKCYFSQTSDCSSKLSKEHYISHAVLKTIPGGLVVAGAPWLPSGVRKELHAETLAAKVLCERHNKALSPLDKEVGRLFGIISTIYEEFRGKSSSTETSWHLCSGEMLELWGLKVIFGSHRGGVAASGGKPIRTTHGLDVETFLKLLSARHLSEPSGLYMIAPPERHARIVGPGVKAVPIGIHEPPRIGGVEIGIHGLDFDIVFDPSAVDGARVAGSVYRPRFLTFRKGQRRHTIMLTWSSQSLLMPELDLTFPE
jgi:hypothetical protein